MTASDFSPNRRSLLGASAGLATVATAWPQGAQAQSSSPVVPDRPAGFSYPAGVQIYRTQPPARPLWPDGAKTVMAITAHLDGPGVAVGRNHNPLGAAGGGYYSLRAGVHRHLDVFAAENVKATFMVPGYDALVAPKLFREISDAGHDLCLHGYYHRPGEGKAADLEKSFKILSDITGKAPKGFCSPGGAKDRATIRILQKLGCIYDASDKDDDVPYMASIDGVTQNDFVILPNNTSTIDDAPMYDDGQQLQEEVLAEWSAELDAIHATTGYYQLSYHTVSGWGSGTPDRAWKVAREFIRTAKTLPGLKIMQMRELAEYCIANPDQFRLKTGNNTRI